ncbi:MAG: energy-coupling factor transporter ATPase [Lachnospiraceae bacterium]|nr:energy-coupling factor transporter ATPase [Lachnospiraceae bacterium]
MSIIVDHVSHIYEADTNMAVKALDDVNLVIRDGEFIGLIGHTGSGKSTLVQHLNGLMKATEGHIYFDGKDIDDSDYNKKELRSKVGLVFQYPEHQLFEIDVFTDVCFGPKNLGLEEKEVQLRAFEALKQVGLEDEYFYQSPFDLSGGQKRRVAIAGVLAMKPEVLILDEPTAGLDPKGQDEILGLIASLREKTGMTIILVSHNMDDVAEYVDRIVVMNHGRKVFDDVPKTVFSHVEELEAMGLAAPQVSYLMHTLQKEGFDVRTDATTIAEATEEILRVFGRSGHTSTEGGPVR